jgi:hypothetical protein
MAGRHRVAGQRGGRAARRALALIDPLVHLYPPDAGRAGSQSTSTAVNIDPPFVDEL